MIPPGGAVGAGRWRSSLSGTLPGPQTATLNFGKKPTHHSLRCTSLILRSGMFLHSCRGFIPPRGCHDSSRTDVPYFLLPQPMPHCMTCLNIEVTVELFLTPLSLGPSALSAREGPHKYCQVNCSPNKISLSCGQSWFHL